MKTVSHKTKVSITLARNELAALAKAFGRKELRAALGVVFNSAGTGGHSAALLRGLNRIEEAERAEQVREAKERKDGGE